MMRKTKKTADIEPETTVKVTIEHEHQLDEIRSTEVSSAPDKIRNSPAPESLPNPNWSNIKRLNPDSLAARWLLEHRSVIREMRPAYATQVVFYTKPEGGSLSMDEAIRQASGAIDGPFDVEALYDRLVTKSPNSISWYQIDRLFRYDPLAAHEIWEEIKEAADADFKSGHYAAQLFERTEWQRDPWKRAHFIAIRDSFIDQFKPQGGIDYSMVDMLAVTFTLWMHWTELHIQRSTTEPRREPPEWVQERERQDIRMKMTFPLDYEKGEWDIPYISDAEAIEQSAVMADRFRRSYQSQLRAMRDWRRWSAPVIVHNAEQVNIASDGGQQMNLQKKTMAKGKEQKAAGRARPMLKKVPG